MAETKVNPEVVKAAAAVEFAAESQRQRWVKYGLNVALTIIVVIALAGFVTYIAQSKSLRKDTTAGGSYSLKPQTVALVEDLDSRMRLQKVQTVMDVELPKVIAKLEGLTVAAAPTPPATGPAATKPAVPPPALIPGAQALRDRLITIRAGTQEILRGAQANGKKIADSFDSDLEGAAAEAGKAQSAQLSGVDAKKLDGLKDAIKDVEGLAKQVKNYSPQLKIVGLFTKAKNEENQKVVEDVEDKPEVRYQQVADLLGEYQHKSGGRISTEMVDPTNDPEKLDKLFLEVQEKYGNNVKKYRDVLDAYSTTVKEIRSTIEQQRTQINALPKITDERLSDFLESVKNTFDSFGTALKKVEDGVKDELGNRVPNYQGAANNVRTYLEIMKQLSGQVAKEFKSVSADAKTPAELKQFLIDGAPRFESIRKSAEDLLAKMTDLGDLKQVDDLRQNKTNSIAIMGENDLKVVPMESVYQIDENVRSEGKVRARFAGEQQISSALVTLTSREKKKVAIIRSGGPPLATPVRMRGGGPPPFMIMAQRLRDLDIDVLEKDISGQWAMQAMQMQMQGMPPGPPEPGDEQLKDAVWIVPVFPQDPQQMMQNPAAGQLGPKLQEHLKNGGSAMVLFYPQTEKMDFLKDWGIEAKTQFVAVHEKVEAQGAKSDDPAMEYWRQQPVFLIKEYGDHLVTRSLRSLDGFMFSVVPIATSEPKDKDVKVTALIPIPENPKAWGESDIEPLRQGKEVTFTPKKDGKDDDLSTPLWAGAAAEKSGGAQRLMVIGNIEFASNQLVGMPDEEVRRSQGRMVPRFPGNAELFTNSCYWLLKMDPMIAISPSAMQISRIDPQMSDGTRNVWRGLMIVGLPLMVLAAGTFVWLKRRD